MSVVPDMGLPNTMSEVGYAALPEGVARRIGVVLTYPFKVAVPFEELVE